MPMNLRLSFALRTGLQHFVPKACTGIALLLGMVCTPRAGAADQKAAKTVGALGMVRHLQFTGNHAFTAELLRAGLRSNTGWMLAAHPDAPLEDFLTATRERLERGYRSHGFPFVKVTVTHPANHPDQVVCAIEEGARYNAAQVRILGAHTIPEADLIRYLTTSEQVGPPPAPNAANVNANANIGGTAQQVSDMQSLNTQERTIFWEIGKPASLDPINVAYETDEIKTLLSSLGWMQAKVELSTERDDQAHTATLVVKILDEGPQAVIGKIEITGAARDTTAEIIRYLGIAKGQTLTTDFTTRVDAKLRSSGRYITHKVTTEALEGDSRQMTLRLELAELKEAPKLSAPLSPAQQTLVKAGAWLEEVRRTGREDVTFRYALLEKDGNTMRVDGLYQPARGWILSGLESKKADALTEPPTFFLRYTAQDFSILWRRGSGPARWLHGPQIAFPLQTVKLSLKPDLRDDGSTGYSMLFNADWKSTDDPLPPKFDFDLPPSLMVLFGAQLAGHWASADGIGSALKIKVDETTTLSFAVEEATGRFKTCEIEIIEKSGSISRIGLSVAPGAWDAASQSLEKDAAGLTNAFDAKEPWPSWIGFVAHGLFEQGIGIKPGATPAEIDARAQAAHDVTRDFLIMPLEAVANAFTTAKDAFIIPMDPLEVNQISNNSYALLGSLLMYLSDSLVEEDSWPWLLMREMVYISYGHTEHTAQVLDEIAANPKLGPMGAYAVSQILASQRPPDSVRFLELARSKLSAKEFQKDWQLMLNSPFGKQAAFMAFLAQLQKGHREEIDLAKSLADSFSLNLLSANLDSLSTVLAANASHPLDQILKPTMDQWWNKTLGPDYQKAIAEQLDPKDAEGHPIPRNGLAAVVEGSAITREEVLETVRAKNNLQIRMTPATPEQRQQQAAWEKEALNALIERELIIHEFHRLGGTIQPAFVDQQVNQIAQENFGGDMEKFRAALAQAGMTLERFRGLQEKMIIVQAMKKKFEESVPAPTEADIAAAIAELPPQRSIKISTLTVADQDSARTLLGKLKSGVDFAALAKENSKDSRASDGGASDWIEVTSLSPDLAKALAVLKPGQLSAVLPVGSVFMILRLDQERQTAADQLTREQKVEAAQIRNRRLGLDKTLKDLRSKARIQMITP